jgi:hypothetical protein
MSLLNSVDKHVCQLERDDRTGSFEITRFSERTIKISLFGRPEEEQISFIVDPCKTSSSSEAQPQHLRRDMFFFYCYYQLHCQSPQIHRQRWGH